MHKEQQGHTALFSLQWMRRATRFFPPLPCHRLCLRWLMLATICFALLGPAQAAEKPTGKKPPAVAATAHEARLPGDAIARGILSRARPSDKDNTAVLLPLTGTWDYVESFWTDPKGEPAVATGFVTNEMVLDAHYLSSKALGSLNLGGTIPFEAQELIGFDTAKKSLSFTEADTLTTGMTTGSGKFDEKAKVIRETGRFTHPMTGVEQGFRSEIAFVDFEHYKRTVFAAGKNGKETKLMEFDYTRRK